MTDPTATDYLSALLSRIDVVRRLADGVTDKREITEAVDASRPTVDRAVHELEEVGIVERGQEGYALTAFGELLHAEYEKLEGKAETLGAARDLLEVLVSHDRFEVEVIADADVTLPPEYAPHEPITQLREHVAAADTIRLASPVVTPGHVELFEDLTGPNVEGKLLLDERPISYLRSTYRETFEALVREDGIDVRKLSRPPAFGIFLKDDQLVCLIVTDDDGTLCGTVTTENRTAIDWADAVFGEKWNRCRTVG